MFFNLALIGLGLGMTRDDNSARQHVIAGTLVAVGFSRLINKQEV